MVGSSMIVERLSFFDNDNDGAKTMEDFLSLSNMELFG
jgi:hypothetical protein